MKYYKLENSLNIKEIGKFLQSTDYKVRGNLLEFLMFGQEKELVLPELILEKKARPTTYISAVTVNSAVSLVVKNYFVDFLKEFKTGPCQSWGIKIHHEESILNDYSVFYLKNSSEKNYIDYKKSEFLIGKIGDWKDPSTRKPISISNHENYISTLEVLRESNNGSEIRCNKLIFNLSRANEDLFRLANMPYFGSGYYVSERLKNAIEEQRFTGMAFKEISEVDKRIEVVY